MSELTVEKKEINEVGVEKKFETKTCKECQKKFRLYEGEKEFYTQSGLQEPKRCPKCRFNNKLRRMIRDEVVRHLEHFRDELVKAVEKIEKECEITKE